MFEHCCWNRCRLVRLQHFGACVVICYLQPDAATMSRKVHLPEKSAFIVALGCCLLLLAVFIHLYSLCVPGDQCFLQQPAACLGLYEILLAIQHCSRSQCLQVASPTFA